MNRKEFLKSGLGALAAVLFVPVSTLLSGCAVKFQTLRAEVKEKKIRLAMAELTKLSEPEGFVKLYAAGFAHPIVVFNHSNEIYAVSTTCTHQGCEVRKTKYRFECPCHGSQYDFSGKVLREPALEPLTRFPAERQGEFLEIDLGRQI